MGKKHFTEEQIAYALRQHEAGTPVAALTRKLGVSEQTFYRWKRKFGGSGVSRVPVVERVFDQVACLRSSTA